MVKKISERLKSLKIHLLLMFVPMLIAIVFVLVLLVTHIYTGTILEQENSRIQDAFSITARSVEKVLRSADHSTISLFLNKNIEQYASKNYKGDVPTVLSRLQMLDTLEASLNQNPMIEGLVFVREDETVFGKLPLCNIFWDERFDNFFVNFLNRHKDEVDQGGCHWFGPVPGESLYSIKVSLSKPNQVVIGILSFSAVEYGKLYGLTVLDVSPLQNAVEYLTDSRSSIYLVNEDKQVLASTGGSRPFNEEIWQYIDPTIDQKGIPIPAGESMDQSFMSYQKINSLGWYLIRVLPMREYIQTAHHLKVIVWVLAGVLFFVTLFIYLHWVRKFVNHFHVLRGAIRQLENGNLGKLMGDQMPISEFEEIRCEFNKMNQALQKQMEENKIIEHEKLALELRTLQTQLSPHMIFNSITAIRWMADMKGEDQISDMLIELSEMLRPIFRDWTIEWTMKEEADHLSHYAKLLDVRYESCFSIDIRMPDHMREVLIPRFTLQPIVENACEHGGVNREFIHVEIEMTMQENRVVITIKDNGVGIPQEDLDMIKTQIKTGAKPNRVGLYNVYSRLKICKKNSTMEIDNVKETGTIVTLSWEI